MDFELLCIATLTVLTIFATTYTWTSLRYRVALLSIGKQGPNAKSKPLTIPYIIPWLGQTLAFLAPHPGRFFLGLLSWHPRESGACTLLLGGQNTHIIFSATAVQALFKVKHSVANRENFHKIFLTKATGMSNADHAKLKYWGAKTGKREEDLHQEFMLRQSGVNELTRTFVRFFKQELASATKKMDQGPVLQHDLYSWLRPMMIRASVTAFMGKCIIDVYPELDQDFAHFDKGILDLVFGLPKILKPRPYAAKAKILDGFTRWIQAADKETNHRKPDPRNPEDEWEPLWGSRFSRARQALWIESGMSQSGRASVELGLVFGLNSNAIPATGWMLMHILDPENPHLLPRVLDEIQQAVTTKTDDLGSGFDLNINQLLTSPLLQSIFHEVLRMYVDVFVAREVHQDFELPLDAQGDSGRSLIFEKNSIVIAPSIASHYDSTYFVDPPANVFHAERFLVPAPTPTAGNKYMFSAAGAGSRMWPWGGGKTICPGRIFAKQEVLAAVALVLLMFDIEAVHKETYRIPGFSSAYSGSGTIVPDGDVQVHIGRKLKVSA